jgi:APA family basic amino acid/polyamine antiporter
VYYAAAADGYLPSALARLHPKYGTPTLAIVVQAIWAILLVLTGTYGDLLNSVVFADWIFFGGTVAALFVWRSRPPNSRTPESPNLTYRSPGYPLLPGFFVLVAIAVVISVIIAAPARAAGGALLIATGVPVFYYFSGRRERRM